MADGHRRGHRARGLEPPLLARNAASRKHQAVNLLRNERAVRNVEAFIGEENTASRDNWASTESQGGSMERRDFLRSAVAGLAATTATTSPAQQASVPGSQKKTIAIQIGAESFMDEGVEKVFDILQEKASVNALFLAVYDFGNGIAGRQLPGHP